MIWAQYTKRKRTADKLSDRAVCAVAQDLLLGVPVFLERVLAGLVHFVPRQSGHESNFSIRNVLARKREETMFRRLIQIISRQHHAVPDLVVLVSGLLAEVVAETADADIRSHGQATPERVVLVAAGARLPADDAVHGQCPDGTEDRTIHHLDLRHVGTGLGSGNGLAAVGQALFCRRLQLEHVHVQGLVDGNHVESVVHLRRLFGMAALGRSHQQGDREDRQGTQSFHLGLPVVCPQSGTL